MLTDLEFVRVFLPDAVGKKEDKILKAFADKNKENALKTKPKVREFLNLLGFRRDCGIFLEGDADMSEPED